MLQTDWKTTMYASHSFHLLAQTQEALFSLKLRNNHNMAVTLGTHNNDGWCDRGRQNTSEESKLATNVNINHGLTRVHCINSICGWKMLNTNVIDGVIGVAL